MKTISLYTNAPALSNDMAEVLRLFYGNITLLVNEPGGDWTVTHEERIENNIRIVRVYDSNSAYETSETLTGDAINDKRLRRRQAKLGVYRLLKERTGITPPWGSLTGIRPVLYILRWIKAARWTKRWSTYKMCLMSAMKRLLCWIVLSRHNKPCKVLVPMRPTFILASRSVPHDVPTAVFYPGK